MKDIQMPSEDLLNRIRHIGINQLRYPIKAVDDLGKQDRLRSYLGEQLFSCINDSGFNVFRKESRSVFSDNYKLTYLVKHRGVLQLEFKDVLREGTDQRKLESVKLYHPGEWENKVRYVFQTCMDIRNRENMVLDLIKQLKNSCHTPEDFISLIDATGDTKQTIKLLALSSEWEGIFGSLSLSYSVLGKCKEAEFVSETFVSVYPENADLHLAFGNLFLGALINSNPVPGNSFESLKGKLNSSGAMGRIFLESLEQSDPSLYKELMDVEARKKGIVIREALSGVTLSALGYTYEYAVKRAEDEIRKAISLSRTSVTRAQADRALSALLSVKTFKESLSKNNILGTICPRLSGSFEEPLSVEGMNTSKSKNTENITLRNQMPQKYQWFEETLLPSNYEFLRKVIHKLSNASSVPHLNQQSTRLDQMRQMAEDTKDSVWILSTIDEIMDRQKIAHEHRMWRQGLGWLADIRLIIDYCRIKPGYDKPTLEKMEKSWAELFIPTINEARKDKEIDTMLLAIGYSYCLGINDVALKLLEEVNNEVSVGEIKSRIQNISGNSLMMHEESIINKTKEFIDSNQI